MSHREVCSMWAIVGSPQRLVIVLVWNGITRLSGRYVSHVIVKLGIVSSILIQVVTCSYPLFGHCCRPCPVLV